MGERAVERRIVSVLFADLVGFTSLSERLDSEDVALVQDAYFAAARETVARHGGVLEKFVGDAVMAVFGSPRTRDDDAERAVRAGLALIAAVDRLNATLELEEATLRVRVGVSTGETLHGEASADRGPVTGDTVNVAARLQAAAEPGALIVGELTALAVADAVELEQLEPLQLKGKAEPVRASRVTGLYPMRSRERALGLIRAATVGREEEVALLRGLVGRTTRLVVIAPPGVGKTRMVDDVAAAASAADATVLRARLRPDVLSPYEPLAQLVASGGGAAALPGALAQAGVKSARAAVVAELLTHAAAGETRESLDRDQLFEAWREGLDALACDRPALWIVEDAHWASRDLLAFLAVAAGAPSAAGRAVVATARPALFDREAAWVESAERLDLEPLGDRDAAMLVRALVGDVLPGTLVDQVVEHAGGNPLFVEELVRLWVDAGVLVHDGGRWALAVATEEVPLPLTVQAIYAGQLDDLPEGARILARRAAIAGRRFPEAALEPLELQGTRDSLEELSRRGFVGGPLDDVLLGDSWVYRHALLRDAGYASLARAERARLHLRLAQWLRTRGPPATDSLAEVIGRHFAAAAESAPRLVRELDGSPIGEIRREAAAWFEHAAATAAGIAAWDTAAALAARALDLTGDDETLALARRRLAHGQALADAVGVDEAVPVLQQALDGFRTALADGEKTALDGIAATGWALGQLLRAQTLFAAAESLAEALLAEVGDVSAVVTARLLLLRGIGALAARDDFALARADAGRALALGRDAEDADIELEATQLLAQVEGEAGGGRPEVWDELAALGRAAGRWSVVAGALRNRGSLEWDDDPLASLPYTDASAEVAYVHGLVQDAAWADYCRAEAHLSSGAWDDALAAGLRAIAAGEERDLHRVVVRSWFTLRPIAVARGRRDLLERAYPRFEARRGREPDSPYARIVTTAMHLSFADAGLEQAFVPGLEDRLGSFDLDQATPSWLAGVETIIGAWIAVGDLDGADRALQRMRATLERGATGLASATESLLDARIAIARGDIEGAVDRAGRALGAPAPWWRLKAIDLLERLGAAEPELVAEGTAIRSSLGLQCAGL
jgi:class 3 adenylate cyclase/tetratricopeptide (TPR) repeat protein